MKAYVIKNKEGKYFRGFDIISCEPEFCEDIIDSMPYEEDDNAIPVIKDTTIVPITIAEGDLEKALELACKELKARDEGKTNARLVIQQIKNEWLGENVDYKDWFIQQAKESD